ncbi:VTC domain-containing protein [Helicostylum pulchrum]|nr:VTC domain-containing protein [Helicostylum pulchrum]
MKFGNYLKENILNPWRIEYLQYDLLKMDLKSRQLDHTWNNQDELDFIQLFKNERNKVAQFILRFNNQLLSRIQYSKHLLQGCTTLQQTPQDHQQTTEFLNNLDDNLIEIIFDIHDFYKFIQLNKLGFAKILKKHQKWTKIDHTHLSCYEYQTINASLKYDWVASFYTSVSLVRYQCQQHFNNLQRKSMMTEVSTMIPDKTSERRIRKYWVLPHHVSEVIATLCMQTHIVQPIKQNNTDFDFSISNIYLDNDYNDTYLDRLADKKNVRAIKCKRYGSLLNDCIYFENESHTTFYSSDISSKQRLKVDHSQLNDFHPSSLSSSASSPTEEIDEKDAMDQSNETLFAEFVKDPILYSTLKPRLQCDYNRLSFKNHSTHEVGLHVTLDTDIQFFKINNQESYFTNTNNTSVTFPYAVLEVKLSTEIKLDDPLLYWLNTFTQKSNLLQEVPNFTKYLQGTFQLTIDEKLSPPSWTDVFKKGVDESIVREGLSRSRSLRPLLNGKPYRSTIPYSLGNSLKERSRQSQQSAYRKSHSNNDHTSVSITPPETNKSASYKVDMAEKLEVTQQSHPIYSTKSSFLFSPTSSFTHRTPDSSNIILDQDGNPIKYTNQKLSKKKKKIFKLSTVKIEPKVFFANERTFISWLQFCALLLTVALNLLNFGDHMSKVCGAIFLFIAMLLALYALARFQYRAWQLRTPTQTGRFDDIYGPAVLCVLVVAALIINFWLRFSQDQETNHLYPTPVENNSTQY